MSLETNTENLARSPRRFGLPVLVAVAVASAGRAGAGAPQVAHPPRDDVHADAGAKPAKKVRYQCPMHPGVIQDEPGTCPICGMDLVPVETAAVEPQAPTATAPTAEQKQKYQCPMHPTVISENPDDDCPICGMDLVPMAAGAVAPASTAVPGLAAVEIDPARQQLIGLKTVAVETGPVGGSWRTNGKVAIDETRVQRVNLKVGGYVEKIFVDFVGKPVKKGEPLFSIYSPELYAAQEEYLLALETRKRLGGLGADGDALVAAAKRKLELWDIPAAELARLEETGKPSKTLTLRSPANGVVTKKDVVQGSKLDAGAMPYEIVDLSAVWVLADVYESELRNVKVGMPAKLSLAAFPDRAFEGKVAFVDPVLDPKTRTVKVRLSFPNRSGDLRPEMFGEVVLSGQGHDGLRIPADAVIDSGTSHVVFVARDGGKFEPREVKLGETGSTGVEVVSGLHEGERVVTRANFLVDSESRLRASLAELTAGAPGPESARTVPGATADGAAAAPTAPMPEHAGHEGHR